MIRRPNPFLYGSIQPTRAYFSVGSFTSLMASNRARILVDGRSAGFIHYPDDNRVDRWRQADVILPANFTKGKSSIQIRIEPFEGSYNAFTYEAWTIGQ